eukprot:Partr_v1_DN28613_c2_g1_i2_m49525 putative WD repeat domain 65
MTSTLEKEGIRHIFGKTSSFRNNLLLLEDGNLLFASGPYLVVQNAETRAQQTYMTVKNGVVAAFVYHHQAKGGSFVACAVQVEDRSQIMIYDYPSMKRHQKIMTPKSDEILQDIISMSFSDNGRNMFTLQRFESILTCWSMEKYKSIASLSLGDSSLGIQEIIACPFDENRCLAFGGGTLKSVRLNDALIRASQLSKNVAINVSSAIWIAADKVLAVTETSQVFLYHGADNAVPLNLVGWTGNEATKFNCINAFSNGFVCGDREGKLHAFRHQDGENYEYLRSVVADESSSPGNFTTLNFTSNEESILASTSDGRSYHIPFVNSEVFRDEAPVIKIMLPPVHVKACVLSETSLWKPFVASASKDHIVRIWNYLENSCDISHSFDECPMHVSLHYMAMHIAVTFPHRIQILNILNDGLKPVHDINLRNVSQVKYSNGGHMLAAVQGNLIYLYDSWGYEQVAILKGHQGPIRSLCWSTMDYRLISASQDGAVYSWSTETMTRTSEFICKTSGIKFVTQGSSLDSFAIINDDHVLQLVESNLTEDLLHDIPISCCVAPINGQRIYVGADSGSVIILDLKQLNKGPLVEYQISHLPVTSLVLSIDGSTLACTAADGSLTLIACQSTVGVEKQEKLITEEVLVSRTDLEERNSKLSDLKNKAEDLKNENEYQLQLQEVEMESNVKNLKSLHDQRLQELRKDIDVLQRDILLENERYEAEKKDLQNKVDVDLRQMESEHTANMEFHLKNQKDAEQSMRTNEEKWKFQMEEFNRQHQEKKAVKEQECEHECNLKAQEIETLHETYRAQLREHEELIREIEDDAEELVLQTRLKYELKLKEEKDNGVKLKAENAMTKKKQVALVADVESMKSEVQKLHLEERKLQIDLKALEKDIAGLKNEVQERDSAILEKEKRIEELKKKNQEMEKFKFVLDYKIRELKNEIEPREKELQTLMKQISEMDLELVQHHQKNNALELKASEFAGRIRAGNTEIKKIVSEAERISGVYRKFQIELGECAASASDAKLMKSKLVEIYQRYCKDGGIPHNVRRNKRAIKDEITRQREQMERSLSGMKQKLARDKVIHREENTRLLRENMTMIE